MEKRVKIELFDGTKLSGDIIDIEFEGTDGGYPVYTATIKCDNGKEYYVNSGPCKHDFDYDELYIQDDEEDNFLYIDYRDTSEREIEDTPKLNQDFIKVKDQLVKHIIGPALNDGEFLEDCWDSFGKLVKSKSIEELIDSIRLMSWDAEGAINIVNEVIEDKDIRRSMLDYIQDTYEEWDT